MPPRSSSPTRAARRGSLAAVLFALGPAACGLFPKAPASDGSGGSGGPAGGTGGHTSSAVGGTGAGSGHGGAAAATGGTTGSSGGAGTGGRSTGGGGSGGTGTGTGGAPPPSRGPTPARAGLNFPFPQNRQQSRCVYPALYQNDDVQAAYDQWKLDTITTNGAKVGSNQYRRVMRPAEPELAIQSTVSEGIAYGMLIAVYMGDQALFDDLWRYEQGWLDENGLMNWYIDAAGTMPLGLGAATDADEDMAFALLMADRQWGGMGALDKPYLQHAKDQIAKIWSFEIFDYKYVKPGDTWGDATTLNVSYLAPAYYRLFARVDTANTTNWNNALQTSYAVLAAALNANNSNQANGLVPAWCDSSGVPNSAAFMTGAPTNYQYDACRTPFRIGMDWCLFGEMRAKDYVTKTSNFFSGIGATRIVDGYDLNGNPHPQYQTGAQSQTQSASFVGPAAVGAMSDASYQSFLNQSYTAVATRRLLVGGTYYDESWTVLSLLMMTANFLDYTAY